MIEGLLQPRHLLVILAVALFLFGPKKLPELGKGLADGIRGFKKAINPSSHDSAYRLLAIPSQKRADYQKQTKTGTGEQTMKTVELDRFRKILNARQSELSDGRRNREAVAIETSADELDRIQHAQERDFAMEALDRGLLAVAQKSGLPWSVSITAASGFASIVKRKSPPGGWPPCRGLLCASFARKLRSASPAIRMNRTSKFSRPRRRRSAPLKKISFANVCRPEYFSPSARIDGIRLVDTTAVLSLTSFF